MIRRVIRRNRPNRRRKRSFDHSPDSSSSYITIDEYRERKNTSTNTADSIEGELVMVITITTIQCSIIAAFPSFYVYSDLVAFDSTNTYLNYDMAPFLTPFIWTSVQVNVLSFFVSWSTYICWRSLRPASDDHHASDIFHKHFSKIMNGIYAATLVGLFFLGSSYYHIIILKSGDRNSSQVYNFGIGIVWTLCMVCCTTVLGLNYVKVKEKLCEYYSKKSKEKSPEFGTSHLALPDEDVTDRDQIDSIECPSGSREVHNSKFRSRSRSQTTSSADNF